MNEQRDRPRVEWVVDKSFEKDGITVQVTKLALRRPRYSVSVGRTMEHGTSKNMALRSEGKGQISILKVSVTVYELLCEAEDYVQSELQYAEDQWVETQQHFEDRDMNRGKKSAPVGLSGGPNSGKTARKRENRRKRMAGNS